MSGGCAHWPYRLEPQAHRPLPSLSSPRAWLQPKLTCNKADQHLCLLQQQKFLAETGTCSTSETMSHVCNDWQCMGQVDIGTGNTVQCWRRYSEARQLAEHCTTYWNKVCGDSSDYSMQPKYTAQHNTMLQVEVAAQALLVAQSRSQSNTILLVNASNIIVWLIWIHISHTIPSLPSRSSLLHLTPDVSDCIHRV